MNVDAIVRHALISHFLLDRESKKQFAFKSGIEAK